MARPTLFATLVALSLALTACSAGDRSATPTPEPADSPAVAAADLTGDIGSFGQSCEPPAPGYRPPQTGELPSGQRLAWVSDETLWALVEDCPWPRRVWDGAAPPRWSPDGRWLAFVVDEPGFRGRLWLAPVDGGDSPLQVRADGFAWTPDSGAVVFTYPLGPEEGSGYGIWLGDVEDGAVSKLADAAQSEFALSPDGRTVAFWREEPCPAEVVPAPPQGVTYTCSEAWSVDVAGGEPRRLAGAQDLVAALPADIDSTLDLGVSWGSRLAWSPDGGWLTLYACGVSASLCAGTQYLFALRPDGSALRYLYSTVGPLDWAADGSRLVTADAGRYFDVRPRPLVVIDPATGDREEISPAEVEDSEPRWSPRGDILAFTSSPPLRTPDCPVCPPEVPQQGVWTMRPDGSERRQLTSAADWRDWQPRWSESGEWVLFTRQGPEYVPDEGFAATGLWLMRSDGSDLHLLAGLSGSSGVAGPQYDWWTSGGP